jgi:hypothetical protein
MEHLDKREISEPWCDVSVENGFFNEGCQVHLLNKGFAMFRLFALKPFVSLLFVISFLALAPEAYATCMVRCSGKLIYEDCNTPPSPNTWPADLLPTFQVSCETCCSPPGGPLQCSDSSFNVTDFVLRDAQGQPLSGSFILLAKTCDNKLSLQYNQKLAPAKDYDLLSSVPGGGNLILLQFDVTASSHESHSESLPDHEGHNEAGNPEEPVHDTPPTDTPPTDTPPTDRKSDDGGPDAIPDACGTAADASPSDATPSDGCNPTNPDTPPSDNPPSDNLPSDNPPSDNPPSDNANSDNAGKDSAGGWSCETTSSTPTGLFFLLFGLLFFKRRRSERIAQTRGR